jgi:hypothetical protein
MHRRIHRQRLRSALERERTALQSSTVRIANRARPRARLPNYLQRLLGPAARQQAGVAAGCQGHRLVGRGKARPHLRQRGGGLLTHESTPVVGQCLGKRHGCLGMALPVVFPERPSGLAAGHPAGTRLEPIDLPEHLRTLLAADRTLSAKLLVPAMKPARPGGRDHDRAPRDCQHGIHSEFLV